MNVKRNGTNNKHKKNGRNLLELLSNTPKIKVWVNAPNPCDVFTGIGILWVVDLQKGVAKKSVWLNERNLEFHYPEYRTYLRTIEEYLLILFRSNGFDIRLDLRKKEKGLVKFVPPLIDRNKIER
jgi:hypothetical protein